LHKAAYPVFTVSVGIGGTYSNTYIDFASLSFPSQLSSSGFNRSLPTAEPYLSNTNPNTGSILTDPSEEGLTVLNTGLWYRKNEAIIPYLGLTYGEGDSVSVKMRWRELA
jgi:hypothetical protein